MTAVEEPAAVEEAAIVQAALDYYEGWYDGDAARMEHALHPELAKRSLARDPSGGEALETITAQEMIASTREGHGRRSDPAERRLEVEVVDAYETIASVTVRSAAYGVEYLQLARTREGWKIVNVLWLRR